MADLVYCSLANAQNLLERAKAGENVLADIEAEVADAQKDFSTLMGDNREEDRNVREKTDVENGRKNNDIMKLNEVITVKEWHTNLGGRLVYSRCNTVEVDKIPEAIDWDQEWYPPQPPTTATDSHDIHDRHIVVRYFSVGDDIQKAAPLARFDAWENTLQKHNHPSNDPTPCPEANHTGRHR